MSWDGCSGTKIHTQKQTVFIITSLKALMITTNDKTTTTTTTKATSFPMVSSKYGKFIYFCVLRKLAQDKLTITVCIPKKKNVFENTIYFHKKNKRRFNSFHFSCLLTYTHTYKAKAAPSFDYYLNDGRQTGRGDAVKTACGLLLLSSLPSSSSSAMRSVMSVRNK